MCELAPLAHAAIAGVDDGTLHPFGPTPGRSLADRLGTGACPDPDTVARRGATCTRDRERMVGFACETLASGFPCSPEHS